MKSSVSYLQFSLNKIIFGTKGNAQLTEGVFNNG